MSNDTYKFYEAKIAELEKLNSWDDTENAMIFTECELYKKILSESIVLPIEESWEDVERYTPDNESQVLHTLKYKNGVIIKNNATN